MSPNQQVHQMLLDAKNGKLPPQELFPRLASAFSTVLTTFERPQGSAQLPRPDLLVTVSTGEELPVLITDAATGRKLLGEQAERLQECPMRWALQLLIRCRAKGAVINPGPEELVLTEQHLRLLFREYALLELSGSGGAWVPTQDGEIMLFEVQPRLLTIPVYLAQEEAQLFCGKFGGKVEWHSWPVIRSRSLATGTDGVFLQCLLPEQAGLARPYVTRLAGAPLPDPVEEVEQVIAKSGGLCMPADLWPALSKLDGVWVLTDQQDGQPLMNGKVFDLFTSLSSAEIAKAKIGSSDKNPPIAPRFFPAQPLLRWIAQSGFQVAINRGQEPYWIDVLGGLPQVIRNSMS